MTDAAQVERLCDEALDVAGFMRDHVVQAELNERGNYGVPAQPAFCRASCLTVRPVRVLV